MSETFYVQILDKDRHVLTEWIVTPHDDGSEADTVREVCWLRQVTGETTNAVALVQEA